MEFGRNWVMGGKRTMKCAKTSLAWTWTLNATRTRASQMMLAILAGWLAGLDGCTESFPSFLYLRPNSRPRKWERAIHK